MAPSGTSAIGNPGVGYRLPALAVDRLRGAVMFTELAELDAAIEAASRILALAREGGFQDCVAAIVEDIRQVILPGCTLLLCASDGAQRKAIGKRYRRLQKMVL